jgi:hypothetical protein
MNIWAWIEDTQRELEEAGHHRLARIIEDLPEVATRGTAAELAALRDEAVAGARAINNPWLEVYFRHWEMQGRINNHNEAESALKDVIATFEFAHRHDTEQCPQSICVTQDVALIYSNVDGPGWANARIEVCEETLARITPDWPCYECICTERGDALQDAGRYEEAFAQFATTSTAMRANGNRPRSQVPRGQARARLALGDAKEALRLVREARQRAGDEDEDEDEVAKCDIVEAQCLTALGQLEAAWARLPAFEDLKVAQREGWAKAALPLCEALPRHNTAELGQDLGMLLHTLHGNGAHRDVITVANTQIRLAVLRGARALAQCTLEIATKHLPLLQASLGAEELLADLARQVAALPPTLPVPAPELLGHLAQHAETDLETRLNWLLEASTALPRDSDLTVATARALCDASLAHCAEDRLWQALESQEPGEAEALELLGILMRQNRHAEVERLSRLLEPAHPGLAAWALACRAHAQKRWPELREHARRLETLMPQARRIKDFLADAALAERDFDTLLRMRLAQREAEGSNHRHWDVMTAASLVGDWAEVRRTAALLDMTLTTGEGPVEEHWGQIKLRHLHNGKWHNNYALRTGPCTARIISCAAIDQPQHVRDWVVFSPEPMEPAPSDEEARRQFIYTFEVLHILESGNFGPSWLVDGALPDAGKWEEIRAGMEAEKIEWWITSGDDYAICNPETEDYDLPGMYWLVAAPGHMSATDLHEKLTALTQGLPHPLAWPRLAKAANRDVDVHEERARLYEL